MLVKVSSDVRYWHKADIPTAAAFVRYWTKADNGGFWLTMVCPLMTQSGHDYRIAKCPLMTQSGHFGLFRQSAKALQISRWIK
jgi:hypothetical protein